MQLSYDIPVSSRLPIPSRSRDREGRPHKAYINGRFPDMSGSIETERMILGLRAPFGLEPFGFELMAERQ